MITNIRRFSWFNSTMNIRLILTGLAALAITVSTGVAADEIYKWVDADGNVHYEDRPSGNPSEELLQFSYNRTSSSAVQQRVQTQRDTTAARRDAKEDAEAANRTAAETRAEVEAKVAKCQEYRAQMKTMLESRRLYREDEAGERVYLDDAARTEARQKAEDLIKETCSG